MPYYRLYHMSLDTGHILRADEIFADDDTVAVLEAQSRETDHPLELWQGGSKILRIEGRPEMAAGVPTEI